MNVLVIDNYDSFTYNLVQHLGEMGCTIEVRRNDAVTVDEIRRRLPHRIVISPGPGVPSGAGVSLAVIRDMGAKVPVLGVCLGHQAIAEAFGGKVVPAPQLMHGKTSLVHHQQDSILKGLSSPFQATRYHSLMVERETLPESLLVNAWTEEGIIMGLRHRRYAIFGVQFHPESVLTREGKALLRNFLNLTPEDPPGPLSRGRGDQTPAAEG